VATVQAVVELKPREAEELGGACLVPTGTLERVDDGLARELIQKRDGRERASTSIGDSGSPDSHVGERSLEPGGRQRVLGSPES